MIPFASLHICESEHPDREKKRVHKAEYEKQAFMPSFSCSAFFIAQGRKTYGYMLDWGQC